MRHSFFSLLILCLLFSKGFSQMPFYDALELENLNAIYAKTGDKDTLKKIGSILYNYLNSPDKAVANSDYHNVFSLLADPSKPDYNPILSNIFPNVPLGAQPNLDAIGSAIGSIGSLDVTTIADGFAKFLVERTKEELNVAFFSGLSEKIKVYPDAKVLFPQTSATLDAIGTEIYNYSAYLNTIRESFQKDLSSLLPNLNKVLQNHPAFLNANPILKSVCQSAVYIGLSLLSKEHPGQIIAGYNLDYLNDPNTNKPIDINVSSAVRTLQLFSESLRSKSEGEYWISIDSLRLLFENNDIAFKIYLGLVYQRARGVAFTSPTTLQSILSVAVNSITDLQRVADYLKELLSEASIVSDAIKNVAGKNRDELLFSDYYDLYSSSLDMMEVASQVYLLPGLSAVKPSTIVQDYIRLARKGGEIALDINSRNFGSAIIDLYALYQFGLGSESATNGEFLKFVMKYGSFMAAISQAQSSDDVEKAIEAVALPSGSSRIKRVSSFNVALNSYAGIFLGSENVAGLPSAFNYAVTAPIGVAISGGSSAGWSNSIFITFLDLGAVASFRATNDTVSQVPTIQLNNLVSLGLFWSIGIPKSPISVNLGIQTSPNLRSVSQAKNDYSDKMYWRFGAGICVDIPLLNFYTNEGE